MNERAVDVEEEDFHAVIVSSFQVNQSNTKEIKTPFPTDKVSSVGFIYLHLKFIKQTRRSCHSGGILFNSSTQLGLKKDFSKMTIKFTFANLNNESASIFCHRFQKSPRRSD
ncbi:MAG: hypothetical protein ACRENG_33640, partial [bacterium]